MTTPILATDPLARLMDGLDGPQHSLLHDVLQLRIARYLPSGMGPSLDALEARVFCSSINALSVLVQGRILQRRASPFALDRVANLAQIATSQLEAWEEYAAHDSVDMSTDREIAGLAAAKARAQVLDELLACLREGSATPWMLTWAGDGPPDIVDEAGDPICDSCNGSGEGQHGGMTCTDCKGLGVTALDVRA